MGVGPELLRRCLQTPYEYAFVERLLSGAATREQQDRLLLDYLAAACVAAQSRQPVPSLLPLSLVLMGQKPLPRSIALARA